MTLAILLTTSILMVWLLNKLQSTRKLLKEACSINRHHSFILDLTLLLPLVGLLVEILYRRIESRRVAVWFPTIAGSLFLFGGWSLQNTFVAFMGLPLYVLFAPDAILGGRVLNWWSVKQTFYTTAFWIFFTISCSLYLDYFNFYFLTPFLGHPEAWGGNHFMWNSGIEVLGLQPIVDTTVPTYQNFWGFWNLLALLLLGPVYIWVMIKAGTRLHGLLFGYTEKQTGISALFFESRTK